MIYNYNFLTLKLNVASIPDTKLHIVLIFVYNAERVLNVNFLCIILKGFGLILTLEVCLSSNL